MRACPLQMSFLAKLLQSAHDGALCMIIRHRCCSISAAQYHHYARPVQTLLASRPGNSQPQHCCTTATISCCKLSASSSSFHSYSSVTDVMVVSWLKAPPSPSPRPATPPAPLLLLLSAVSLLSSLCSKGSTSPACAHGAAVRCQSDSRKIALKSITDIGSTCIYLDTEMNSKLLPASLQTIGR